MDQITPELIRSVAKDRLTLIRAALEALRSGKKKEIEKFGDIYSSVSIDDYLSRIEAEQKQAERLVIIRNELGYDLLEQTSNEISAWLVGAGVEKTLADRCAKEIAQLYMNEFDTVDLHQEAIKLALKKQAATEKAKPIPKSRRIGSKTPGATEPNDLRLIVAQGKKKKTPAYEALKIAAYVKNPLEFSG
ncbi:hypothetical protein [Brevibacillus brevis]|uniref:hypothetical protein n=1 Tax=Brevibacillus brevis TaxID=1393 RepID=UPI00211B451B|nr:hypothetical protein [Brevibacillus brevis]